MPRIGSTAMGRGEAGRKIRLCLVITRLISGGAQRVVLDVIQGLNRDDYDLTLVHGSFSEEEGSLLPEARETGARLIEVPDLQRAVSPRRDLRALSALWRLFRRERFDLVHVHTSKAGFLGGVAARMAGRRVVYSPHGHIFGRDADIRGVSGNRPRMALFYALRWTAERLARKVVALTEADKAEQVRLGLAPAGKYVVINNGVRLAPFRACGALDRSAIRESLGLAPTATVIGTVGRLSAEKGQAFLIEALRRVRRRLPGAKLLLVGDGPMRGGLERLALAQEVADHVVFTGLRRDVPAMLCAMDVFALPSLYESQGIALVEALAAGKPVVATRVGGVPSIVEDSVNGLLVPSRDPEALAEAILRLAGDPPRAERLGRRGADDAAARFSVEKMVAAHDRLYRSLVGGADLA